MVLHLEGYDESTCVGSFSVLISSQAKKKVINYIESDSEGTDGDDVFKPKPAVKSRPNKRRRVSESADEDVYEQENEPEQDDDGMFTIWLTIVY